MINSKERLIRQGFYTRAKYSYAAVVKKHKDNIREFVFFERGKLKNKWLKKILKTPHFSIYKIKEADSFWLENTKTRDIVLEVYFYNYRYLAYGKLNGLIARDRLDQTIQTLNDWTNETLNVDCKLREKVKALLDTIDNYVDSYEVVK